MNAQEELEWGLRENEQRQKDMATVHSQADLKRVQEAARQRRLLVGLSKGKAACLVADAQNEIERRKRKTMKS